MYAAAPRTLQLQITKNNRAGLNILTYCSKLGETNEEKQLV